jgi:hypothetical protein
MNVATARRELGKSYVAVLPSHKSRFPFWKKQPSRKKQEQSAKQPIHQSELIGGAAQRCMSFTADKPRLTFDAKFKFTWQKI